MKTSLEIQNLKCGGCANTILTKISAVEGVSNAQVEIDTNTVTFECNSEKDLETVKQELFSIGYPTMDDKNPLYKKAQSYVSCAIGKINS